MHPDGEGIAGHGGGLRVIEGKSVLGERRRLDIIGRLQAAIGIDAVNSRVAVAGESDPAGHFVMDQTDGNDAAIV